MKKLAMSLAIAAVSITAAAQGPNIYFGLGAGFHSNKMKYSDLNETRFPTNENLNSGVLSVFAEISFLNNHMLAVRPQLSYLRRGGTLKDIEKYEWGANVKDCYYKLNSGFLDFRVPVLFQIGSEKSNEAFRALSEHMLGYCKDEPMFLDNLGSYYLIKKEYKKSQKYFDQVLKKHPGDMTALKNCILMARTRKDVKMEKKYLTLMAVHGETETDRMSAQTRLDAYGKK